MSGTDRNGTDRNTFTIAKEKRMRMITRILVITALLAAACSDNGPTGPSPTPPTTTPPTTTPPGGNNRLPQVAGTYRGSGTTEFKVSSTISHHGTIEVPDACTEVEQDGTMVTIELPIAPWEIWGTITPSGQLEDINVLEGHMRTLHKADVLFNGNSLKAETLVQIWSNPTRHRVNIDVERQPAPAEKCDRTGQTARPGNRD